MDDRTVMDLGKVTVDRVRKAITLTTQLLDDEDAVAAVLMLVASDLIEASAQLLVEMGDSKTYEEALGKVLRALFGAIRAKRSATGGQ